MMNIHLKYIGLLFLLFMAELDQVSAQSKNNRDDTSEKSVNSRPILTCKLTSPELRERKGTVIASLKSQILAKKN